jgi:hypothetical protein
MPNLDSVFQTFATWQTVLFCLGIAIITWVIRTMVEAAWKGAATSTLWNEGFVRVGPIGTGMWLVLTSKTFPWPHAIVGSNLAMIFYGGACGVASAYVYSAFRAWLNAFAAGGSPLAAKVNRMMRRPAVAVTKPPPVS